MAALPDPGIPSSDTLGTLELIQRSGYDHSWFELNRRIIAQEFVLSGSEQNPEPTREDVARLLANRLLNDVPAPRRRSSTAARTSSPQPRSRTSRAG